MSAKPSSSSDPKTGAKVQVALGRPKSNSEADLRTMAKNLFRFFKSKAGKD